ncbi:MAG: 50S ribosomal protein L18 [Anaerolineales bacterium]|nr:50S ribosomal protein L18 [Anaerolineales bacterium]
MAKKKTRYAARIMRHRRVRKHIVGFPERPRLNVFRSLNEIYAQVIDDQAGHTLASASSIDKELRSKMSGLTKKQQAHLVGEKIAERAKAVGVDTVVFDRAGYRYIGRIKALAEGARESGLKF